MSFKVIMKYFLAFCCGIIMTLFSQKAFNNLINYKVDENRVMLSSLRDKVLEFKKICGKLPSGEKGLRALVDPSIENCSAKPILPLVPNDSWDGELIYLTFEDRAYLLSSTPEGSFVKIP